MKIATITQHDMRTGEINGESFEIYWEGEELVNNNGDSLIWPVRSYTEAVSLTWTMYSAGQGYRCQLISE